MSDELGDIEGVLIAEEGGVCWLRSGEVLKLLGARDDAVLSRRDCSGGMRTVALRGCGECTPFTGEGAAEEEDILVRTDGDSQQRLQDSA